MEYGDLNMDTLLLASKILSGEIPLDLVQASLSGSASPEKIIKDFLNSEYPSRERSVDSAESNSSSSFSKRSPLEAKAAHNALEKSRRADLRDCLEKLRYIVPPIPDTVRNTTLALLTQTRNHIVELICENEKLELEKQKLLQYNNALNTEIFTLNFVLSHD